MSDEEFLKERIPEPELMEDGEQARAYAEADFSEPHSRCVALFGEIFPGVELSGYVLDLGCGPGDVTLRFAAAHPKAVFHGIDGSAAMLACGREILAHRPDLAGRVELHRGLLLHDAPPLPRYDAVISNSLLHHLHDPSILWETVRRYAASGSPVFIADLMRPATVGEARRLVEAYGAGEPEILRRDFFHSLLAAFTPAEVAKQLAAAGLEGITVRVVSDRHLVAAGRMA